MIYEDPILTIDYPAHGIVLGHLVISPRQEVQTVDDVSEEVMLQLSLAASYAATVLFETLGAQGSNIVLNEQPLRIEVLARFPDDGWQHQWTPKTVDPQAMDDARTRISDNTPFAVVPAQPRIEEKPVIEVQEPAFAETPDENVSETPKTFEELEEEENYLIRQLTRRP